MLANRGKLLTILIAVSALGYLVSIPHALNPAGLAANFGGNLPGWYYAYYLLAMVLSVASLIGVWLWKKWGACMILTLIFIGLIINIYVALTATPVGPQPQINFISVIWALIILSLWVWAIRGKWSQFN